jgi:hypothetical protein
MAYNDKMVRGIYNHPLILAKILGYNKLSQIHEDWLLWYRNAKEDIYLQAHRDCYKTTTMIVLGTIWELLFNPNLTNCLIRKSEDGSTATLGEIIKQYQSEAMKYIYSEYFDYKFNLKDFNKHQLNLPNRENITKECNIECFGKGGNITGFHFDRIKADDIITMKDRYSKAERESTKEYCYELKNIKKADGRILYTNTPWHIDDASICMPEPKKYPLGSIDIPEMNTPKKLKELQALPADLYACNYLLRNDIAKEGALFTDIRFKKFKLGVTCIGYLDPGYGGACTTGLTLIQENGKELIVKGFAWKEHILDLKEKIKLACHNNNCIELLIERTGVNDRVWREIMEIYHLSTPINEKENKHFKITFYTKKRRDDIYFDDECQAIYMEQIRLYEEGQIPNEAPDSLSALIRERFITDFHNIYVDKKEKGNDFES